MTRKILRFLGSRYGIATILLLLVIVVVGIARANGGTDQDTTVGDTDSSIGTADEGEPNDGVVSPDDEKPTLPDEAVKTATEFAEAYIDTDRSASAWRKAWSENATQRVKDQLKGVGPEKVGINEIQDEPSVEGQSVSFPTDAGLLILRMKEQDGVWLVDGVAIEKS